MRVGIFLRKVWGNSSVGFTLAELLVSLAVLGVIATFTIPKILNAQQNQKFNAIAKEDASTLSSAYSIYQLQNGKNPNIGIKDFISYINYVVLTSTGSIDDVNGYGYHDCNITAYCLKMHNGSIIRYDLQSTFGESNTTNAVSFVVDPDGMYGGSTSGSSKSVKFYLFYNGMLKTWGDIPSGTIEYFGGSPVSNNADPSTVPSWFSWNQ
jgi:prepilin-type N-terminal cleavage/methylation domain-containing protein